jgi:Rrf2 family protein
MSLKTDYGLIALKHISTRPDGELCNAKEIAAKFDLPPNMLAKVLQSLAQGGIVESQKGIGGGYRMARDPAEITLTQVFEAIEGPLHLLLCTEDSGCCTREDLCTVKRGLINLERKFVEFFGSITLVDV